MIIFDALFSGCDNSTEILDALKGAKYISVADIKGAYHQILLNRKSYF